jgi:hypothetical protein
MYRARSLDSLFDLRKVTRLIEVIIKIIDDYCSNIALWDPQLCIIHDPLTDLDLTYAHRFGDGLLVFDHKTESILRFRFEGNEASMIDLKCLSRISKNKYSSVPHDVLYLSDKWFITHYKDICVVGTLSGILGCIEVPHRSSHLAVNIENGQPIIGCYYDHDDTGYISLKKFHKSDSSFSLDQKRLPQPDVEAIAFNEDFIFLVQKRKDEKTRIITLDRSSFKELAVREESFSAEDARLLVRSHLYLERKDPEHKDGFIVEIYAFDGRKIDSVPLPERLIGIDRSGCLYTGGQILTRYLPRAVI